MYIYIDTDECHCYEFVSLESCEEIEKRPRGSQSRRMCFFFQITLSRDMDVKISTCAKEKHQYYRADRQRLIEKLAANFVSVNIYDIRLDSSFDIERIIK